MTKYIGVLFSVLFILISNNIYAYSDSPHEIPENLTISFTGKSIKTYLNLIEAIKKDQLNWYNVSNLKFWQDPIAQAYSVNSIPATFILDENGTVVAERLRGAEL